MLFLYNYPHTGQIILKICILRTNANGNYPKVFKYGTFFELFIVISSWEMIFKFITQNVSEIFIKKKNKAPFISYCLEEKR